MSGKNYLYVIPYIIHILMVFYHLEILQYNNSHKRKPLKDIIMDNCPDMRQYEYILNPLLILFLLPYFQNLKSLKSLGDVFKLGSIFIGIRVITSTVTEIPSSNPECDKINSKLKFYHYIVGHCFDKIFSGHTSLTLLLVLIAYNNNLIKFNKYLILQILQILYAFFLIAIKGHYSVDVFLSYIIVIPIYFLLKDYI